jgi:hypothetical protein
MGHIKNAPKKYKNSPKKYKSFLGGNTMGELLYFLGEFLYFLGAFLI